MSTDTVIDERIPSVGPSSTGSRAAVVRATRRDATVTEADPMLAVGITLQVDPVAVAMLMTQDASARAVIVNEQRMQIDDIADTPPCGPIGDLLLAICDSADQRRCWASHRRYWLGR